MLEKIRTFESASKGLETGVDPFTFDATHDIVAERLAGAKIKLGKKIITIRRAEGWPKETNEVKPYNVIVNEPPGTAVTVKKMMGVLTLISTKDGGCVVLREGEVEEDGQKTELINATAFSKALGLQDKGMYRRLDIEDGQGTHPTLTLVDPAAEKSAVTQPTVVFDQSAQ